MTTRPDPAVPLEPLTPEERDWAARLAQIGPNDGPPPALDTKILAAAHAAVARRPHGRSPRRRWPMLVGAAASLVIVVGLAWQLQPLLRFRPSLGEGPVASAPMAASEGSLSDDVLAAADPVAQTAAKSAPPAPLPSAADKALRPAQAVAEARSNSTPASTPPLREFGDDAIPPYTDYAGMAATRQAASQAAASQASARVAPEERRARAAAAPPQVFPTTRADDSGAMAMPAPAPPASPASTGVFAPASDASANKAPASPPAVAEAEQDNGALDRVEVTGSRIGGAHPSVREDARLEPAAWLQRIRDRRDTGDLDGARESLALFRHHHPRVRLPADLARLGP